MTRPFIEAFCADGLVCIPGADGLLHLSRGFEVVAPETRAGTNRVRNQMSACLSQTSTLLPEDGLMQWQWQVTNDLAERIKAYARATPSDAPMAVQRYRNRKAIHFLRAAEAGDLRRERCTLWLGRDMPQVRPSRDEKRDLDSFYSRILAETAAETAKLAAPMQAILAPVGITLQPLDATAVATDWYRTVHPSRGSRRSQLIVPTATAFSLTKLCYPGEICGLGDHGIVVDGEHVIACALQELPSVVYPGILDIFTTLPIPDFTITLLVRRLPKQGLLAQLQARLRTLQRQLERHHDPELEVKRTTVEEKITQLARGTIVPLEMKFIIILHAPTPEELRRHGDLVKGAVARLNGAQLFQAALAATTRNLFLMTLPGRLHSGDSCYTLYAESDYIGPLLPVPNCHEGHPDCPDALFEGPYRNLIGLRLFVGEGKARCPQHFLVTGMTGSGKSYCLCLLEIETAAQFQVTYILDYGGSHRPFVEAVGGTSLTITPDCPWTFNAFATEGVPFSASQRGLVGALAAQMVGVSRDEDKAREDLALLTKHVGEVCTDFAEAWLRRQPEADRQRLARHALALHRLCAERMCEPLEAFLALREEQANTPDVAQSRLGAATDAEVRTFATKHRDALRELAFAAMREYPTLSSLREHLEVEGLQDERCRRLADLLRPWCRGGAYGTIFDGQGSTAQLTGKVTHLEFGRLNNSAQPLKSALWFLLLIVIRQHCLSRPVHEHKRVIVEEIGQMLQIPNAESIIKEFLSTFRKLNVQCTLVCQQVAQLENAALRSVVLGNVRMALLFHPGDASDLDEISKRLPLSDAAKAMILKYVKPDQLRGTVYSECCYLHLTAGEPYCGTIRLLPIPENENVSL